ncbi:RagB/SusD family nutrient uptake outer membrane protein [Tenuifilum thalassicum]|nr:RagB/SusD family nutrient uptake outer membrane protein [Tenuifilum thalassicum]
MRKIKNISIILFLAIGFVACTKDFLELEPLTDRSEDNFYKTEQDAFEAIVSIYDVLQWQTGGGYHPWDLVCNILSDDAFAGGSGPGDRPGLVRMGKFSNFTNDEEPLGLWKDRYAGIYRANLFLDKVENIQFENEDLKTRFIAEARFLRGYFYYELVQFYGHIPLILKPLSPTENQQVAADPADVYDQIADDLYYAYQNLPENIPAAEKGRASKWAAGALLARVYLFHKGYGKGVLGITRDLKAGDKTLAETDIEAIIDDIVNNSGHALVPNYADLWGVGNENNVESIFEIQHTQKADWGDWNWRNGTEGNWAVVMTGFRGVEDPIYDIGWSFQPASKSLADEFETGDPRYSVSILDAAAEGLVYKPQDCYQHTGYAFKKFYPRKADKPATNDALNWPYNRPVIRFADVLLMGAELNLDNDLGKAQDYYSRVRKRAFGDSHVPPTLTNDADGLDLIYHERRVEFAGEGLRYWDLLRRGLTYAEEKINAAAGAAPLDETFNSATLGLLPIPQTEITLSGNKLTQNAGY